MKVVSTCLWTVLGRSALVVAIEVCVCSLPCCMGALLDPHEVHWVINMGMQALTLYRSFVGDKFQMWLRSKS